MSGNEQHFIKEAFDTNWVVPLGPNVNGFENDLQEFLGNNSHVCALSAGTAAIHLALVQLGVKPGDEVICQSFTFSASANPIKYLGANPVFIDSESSTWNMDPQILEEAIKDRILKTGKKPAAIIPVHLYGMPAKMDEINSIAEKYQIPILEDAAEALGSSYKNIHCGTLGNFGALSFNGNKIITTSGGGALVCKSDEAKKHTLFLATQARENAPHYQHEHIGYNYRLSNICAGIGRGQMTVINDYIKIRRENNALYRSLLCDMPGIAFQSEPSSDFISNFWLTSIIIDPEICGFDREKLRIKLQSENIESRPLWKPMHLQPVFSDAPYYGADCAEQLFNKGLCLPSGPMVTHEDIEKIVSIIKQLEV